MSLKDVVAMLNETGLPVAYDHFSTRKPPPAPYVAVAVEGTDNAFADNGVYAQMAYFAVELCTVKKEPETEKTLTDVMDAHDIAWQKTDEGYNQTDGLYSIFYEFKEIYNGK